MRKVRTSGKISQATMRAGIAMEMIANEFKRKRIAEPKAAMVSKHEDGLAIAIGKTTEETVHADWKHVLKRASKKIAGVTVETHEGVTVCVAEKLRDASKLIDGLTETAIGLSVGVGWHKPKPHKMVHEPTVYNAGAIASLVPHPHEENVLSLQVTDGLD